MFFYARTKGEVERDIQQIGFRSLTICRPSIIAGERSETRIAEGAVLAISRALAPILPKKFHVNPAPVIAASLLDSVLTAVGAERIRRCGRYCCGVASAGIKPR